MNENGKRDELTEEEFLELVLDEQQKALEEERRLRKLGQTKQRKHSPMIRIGVYIIAFTLLFNTVAILFDMYSLPAIEFIKTSTQLSKQPLIQQYKEAVVEVSTDTGKGTGFAISEDGYIITNEHVIEGALSIAVTFPNDGIYQATVIHAEPKIDIAILKIKGDSDSLPYLPLAKSAITSQEHVYFIGNPLSFSGIANEGTLEGTLQLDDWQQPVQMLDAPVYKGNSGSPVFTKDGDVIGVVFATLKKEPYGRVGLFVPIDYVLPLLNN